jgi:hypothetical protein
MAKRLTDTTKWNDSWFTELPMDMKLVWIYILDTCDHAGVYKVNLRLLKFQTGTERTDTEIIEYLKERIYIKADKWFIPKFIMFQYKNFFISKTPAIISAKELLISHNIIQPNDNVLPIITKELDNPYTSLNKGLDNDYIRTKDKDKDKIQDIIKDKEQEEDMNEYINYVAEIENWDTKAERQDMLAEVITGSLDKEQKQMMNKFDNLFADEKQF